MINMSFHTSFDTYRNPRALIRQVYLDETSAQQAYGVLEQEQPPETLEHPTDVADNFRFAGGLLICQAQYELQQAGIEGDNTLKVADTLISDRTVHPDDAFQRLCQETNLQSLIARGPDLDVINALRLEGVKAGMMIRWLGHLAKDFMSRKDTATAENFTPVNATLNGIAHMFKRRAVNSRQHPVVLGEEMDADFVVDVVLATHSIDRVQNSGLSLTAHTRSFGDQRYVSETNVTVRKYDTGAEVWLAGKKHIVVDSVNNWGTRVSDGKQLSSVDTVVGQTIRLLHNTLQVR